jgi:hypothetical protein
MRQIACSTTSEVCTSYNSYLHSNHWSNVKASFRASAYCKRRCYCCKAPDTMDGNIHIHHRSYGNLGKETNYDIVELCGSCHSRVHAIAKDKTIKWTDICFAVEYLKEQIARAGKKKSKQRKTVTLLRVV